MRRSEGESLLLERFAGHFGRPLDLNAPNTFTEKLFSRMVLWNRRMDPQFTQLADKFAVRSYVADTLGEAYLSTLLWHGTDPEQIPFEALPDRYVVKTNHGSGQVIRVAGKVDRADVVRRLSDWLASNYYWRFREYQYYDIPPRVLVEEYLEGAGGREALAYRFWCFGGVPRFLSVGDYARAMCPFYDTNWNKLAIKHKPDANRPFDRQAAQLRPNGRCGNAAIEGIRFRARRSVQHRRSCRFRRAHVHAGGGDVQVHTGGLGPNDRRDVDAAHVALGATSCAGAGGRRENALAPMRPPHQFRPWPTRI